MDEVGGRLVVVVVVLDVDVVEQVVGEIIISPLGRSSDAALPLPPLVLQHIHPPLLPPHSQA